MALKQWGAIYPDSYSYVHLKDIYVTISIQKSPQMQRNLYVFAPIKFNSLLTSVTLSNVKIRGRMT